MEARKLAALLRTLKAAGVATYTCGDLSVTFGDALVLPPVANAEQDEGDLALPSGVIDPRRAIEKIYAERQKGRA